MFLKRITVFRRLFFLSLVLALLVPSGVIASDFTSFGSSNLQSETRKTVGPEFDQLSKQSIITLNTTASMNFKGDITSTGTVDIDPLPATVNYPILVRIQNHGTASLTYVPYVTGATGVTQPTATASHVLTPRGEAVISGKAFQQIFWSAPNISIGASGSQETVVEIWSQTRE